MAKQIIGLSDAIGYIRQFWSRWKPFRIHLFGYALCTMGTSVPVLVAPLIVQRIFNEAYVRRDYKLLLILCSLQVGLALIGAFLSIVATYLATYITNRTEYTLCQKLYRSVNNLPLPDIEKRQKGEFIERMISDIGTLSVQITGICGDISATLFTIGVAIFYMFRISFMTTSLILISAPFAYLFTVIASQKLRKFSLAGRQVAEKLNTFMGETIDGADMLRIYDFNRHLRRRLSELLKNRVHLAFEIWRASTKWGSLAQMSMRGWGFAISVAAWILMFGDRLQFGDVVALGMYIAIILRPIQGISGIYQSLIRMTVAAQRLLDIQNCDKSSKELGKHSEISLSKPPRQIEFKNVSFAYSEGVTILSGVNLRLVAGERVVVLGANGSGKSTLLRILAGLDQRYTGDIYIDDIEMRRFNPKVYRRHISLVPQKIFLFNDSILNNLAASNDRSRDQILQLATKMGIHEMILNCPEELDCIINNEQKRFSGGQEKYIAILRALLKQSHIVLLDEPFANVDIETEDRVFCGFPTFTTNDAIVVIATHGSKWIFDEWINRVIVMDKGQIIDDLTPKSFVKRYPEFLTTSDFKTQTHHEWF